MSQTEGGLMIKDVNHIQKNEWINKYVHKKSEKHKHSTVYSKYFQYFQLVKNKFQFLKKIHFLREVIYIYKFRN